MYNIGTIALCFSSFEKFISKLAAPPLFGYVANKGKFAVFIFAQITLMLSAPFARNVSIDAEEYLALGVIVLAIFKTLTKIKIGAYYSKVNT